MPDLAADIHRCDHLLEQQYLANNGASQNLPVDPTDGAAHKLAQGRECLT